MDVSLPAAGRLSHRLVLAAITTVGFLGCGNSPVVPVSGAIRFADRDQPAVCRLTFVPDESTTGSLRPNGATMNEDGTYTMTEHIGVRGLLPGRYTVRVSYFDLKPNGDPNIESDWIEQSYDAEDLVVEPGSSSIVYDVEVP